MRLLLQSHNQTMPCLMMRWSKLSHKPNQLSHSVVSGFTLLEVLIVITLMALLSSVILTFQLNGDSKQAKKDMDTFEQQWQVTLQQAMAAQEIMALVINKQSYQLMSVDLVKQAFIETDLPRQEFSKPTNLVYSATGDVIEWQYTGMKKWHEDYLLENPGANIVLLLPAGNIKPAFELTFAYEGKNVTLSVDEQGEVKRPSDLQDQDKET